LAFLTALVLGTCLAATEAAPPAIAVVIDDLGYRSRDDRAALTLPGAVSFAILPFVPEARRLAGAARAGGREVLLHLPMEAEHDNHLLGPGALRDDMTHGEFVDAVQRALREVPYLSGVNNHMGSRLTRDAPRMAWLMAELRAHGGLYFLDSRTTPDSRAAAAAAQARLPHGTRDIFLDDDPRAAAVERQFEALLARARRDGTAIGIGHPHPATVGVLRRRLRALGGVELVPVSTIISRQGCSGDAGGLADTSPVTPTGGR